MNNEKRLRIVVVGSGLPSLNFIDEIFNEIRDYKTYTNLATKPTHTKLATQPTPLL